MATAKTTKNAPAAKPAAVKPAVTTVAAKPAAPVAKPVASKPVPAAVAAKPAAAAVAAKTATPKPAPVARAAAEKPDDEAVVHSAKIASEPAPQPVAKPAEPTVDTVIKTSKAATAAAVKATQDAGDSVLRGVAPLLEFSRDNAILLVSTGNQLALGLHKLSQSLLDWSAESCDKGVAAGQAMLSAKTVEEVIDLSQSLAKDSLEQFFKEGSELSKLSAKLIEDAIAPLPSRLAAAVEKLTGHAP